MATFDYQITDANIGDVLPVADGFLVTLTRTKAGPYEVAQWSEGKQQWLTGHLVLRGSRDIRDLICIDTQHGGGWASHSNQNDGVLLNRSLPYAGDLQIVCVPRGSTWSITLSDIPYIPPPPTWPPTFPREAEERVAALRAKIAGELELALVER